MLGASYSAIMELNEKESIMAPYLEITQLREGVDNDTEDDVESDGSDEDEEGEVEDDENAKSEERVFGLMAHQVLQPR